MSVTNNVTVSDYNGSLLSASLLSGNSQTLILNSFGPSTGTTVTENNNSLQVGETIDLGDGRTVTVLGSGTAQPGVKMLGATVPLGQSVPLVLVEDNATGELIFMYPEGSPNLLGAVAVVVTVAPKDYTFPEGVICFAAGTLIPTEGGLLPVQAIRPGMRVVTLDNGLREVVWTGCRTISEGLQLGFKNLQPITIAAGALGPGCPDHDLVVSPQHRIRISSPITLRMFGDMEVLVAAKQLLGVRGISQRPRRGGVVYCHFLTEGHDLIMTNGVATETFYPGPEALKMVDHEAQKQILAHFPDLAAGAGGNTLPNFVPARTFVQGRRARNCVERHIRSGKCLLDESSRDWRGSRCTTRRNTAMPSSAPQETLAFQGASL